MASYTSEEIVTRRKRFILQTPWPQGAAIGELYKMLAAVEQHVNGDDHDDRAWVVPEDDRIVVYVDSTTIRVEPDSELEKILNSFISRARRVGGDQRNEGSV